MKMKRGFTLVETLVVIAIIVILASLVAGGLSLIRDKQAREKARVQIHLLATGLEEYKLDNGDYPQSTSADGSNSTNVLYKALYFDAASAPEGSSQARVYVSDLNPASKNQMWLQGTGEGAKIIDPWKQEYRYRTGTSATNPDFDLWSSGKDQKTDSDATRKDDVTE